MRPFLTVLAFFSLLQASFRSVGAQASVQLKDLGVVYTFGEKVTFSVVIQTGKPIQDAFVLIQTEAESDTHTEPLKAESKGKWIYVHFVQNGLIRPFARVDYWYHLVLTDNTTFDSPHFSFQYDDNRFAWQTLTAANLTVNWVAGDVSFGQAALAAASAGYKSLEPLIPLQPAEPIRIFIYASPGDVQDALNLGGYSWVSGHAIPDLGVVLVSIAPGETQAAEMGWQIPYELAHVLLYRLTGPAYANFPTWLLEGIASQAVLFPDANYAQALSQASQNKALWSISALCGPFPVDASGAELASAESDSFTRFLQSTFGTSSLQNAVKAYADGLTCGQGANQVFGVSLDQLDQNWQEAAFGRKSRGAPLQGFMPYLILLALMLVVPAWRLLGSASRGGHDRSKSK